MEETTMEETTIKKRKRGIATSRAILDVAADLFARRGYDGVSVREIAQGAGIRESSVYNHFSSKADILETLYDEFIRLVPETRPSDAELDRMLEILQPDGSLTSLRLTGMRDEDNLPITCAPHAQQKCSAACTKNILPYSILRRKIM